MNFNYRKILFNLWDLCNGYPINNHLKEISYIFNQTDEKQIQVYSDKYLKNILSHATSTTEFYRKYKGYNNIKDFPIINKSIIKSSFLGFNSCLFSNEQLFESVTSGSTGTPFKFCQDKNKKNRNYADAIYFSGLGGYKIGMRLIYLKIWVEKKKKSNSFYYLQNIMPVDVLHFDESKIKLILHTINKSKNKYVILGYSSVLEEFAKHLLKSNYIHRNKNLKTIIAISESLNEFTKSTLENIFEVPVLSRYSNLENGIIAQQENNRLPHFIINSASYYVEIFKLDSDDPAEEGELGRIVVTDFFNYAMPMIRYDTGDIGAVFRDKENKNRVHFSKIEGRKLDLIYDTKGNIISSYIVYKNMWQYPEIDQYQFIQHNQKTYKFKINAPNGFKKEKQLIAEFKSYLGDDAIFSTEYVNEIPLLSSGKRKKIVNEFNTKK